MTIVGLFIILVFLLLIIKIITPYNSLVKNANFRNSKSLKQSIPQITFFTVSVLSVLFISNQIIGLVILNSLIWLWFYHEYSKRGYIILAWWSLYIYLLFLYSTYTNFEHNGLNQPWLITLFVWSISFIFVLINESIGKFSKALSNFLISIIGTGIGLFALIPMAYNQSTGNLFKADQIFAILQSTCTESNSYISQYLTNETLILFVFLIFISLVLLIFQFTKTPKGFSTKSFLKISLLVLLIANLNVISNIPIFKLVVDTTVVYTKELKQFKDELEKRKAGDYDFTAVKKEQNELSIVIIGESLNKNHMGLYGYVRNTTPLLTEMYNNGDLIKYDNAYANYVHTVQALTYSLTEANQLNQKEYNKSLSILDVQDVANYETYWVSNQIAMGGWDNPISVLANRADHRINFNTNIGIGTKTSNYDGEILSKVSEIIHSSSNKNKVIYVHLMGNHGGYNERYPEEFDKFNGLFSPKYFGATDYWANQINHYDNSVLYNDFVVTKIMKLAEEFEGASSCVYFADHSEDVLHNNGHDHGNFKFSMIEIPFLIWLSNSYKSKYPTKYANLKQHDFDLFSNGFVYDFLIGLNNIKTSHYQEKFDPSSDIYSLPEDSSYTLHRQFKVNNPENYHYYEAKNVRTLNSMGQSNRVFPHRVNSLGKLSNILYAGCKSFELDLVVRENGDSTYFEVGHQEGEMSGMSFEEMLEFSSKWPIEKIWMDVKNINSSNVKLVLNRLNYLNKRFKIKEKALVESNIITPDFSILADAGYNCSYYLPTHYATFTRNEKARVAKQIAKQIQEQRIGAISFDYALYPFVKEFVEPQIPQEIVYHSWKINWGFQDVHLVQELQSLPAFTDTRVKTLIIKYRNHFEL